VPAPLDSLCQRANVALMPTKTIAYLPPQGPDCSMQAQVTQLSLSWRTAPGRLRELSRRGPHRPRMSRQIRTHVGRATRRGERLRGSAPRRRLGATSIATAGRAVHAAASASTGVDAPRALLRRKARSAPTPGIAEAEPTETRFEPRDLGARCRAASPAIGHRIEGPCRRLVEAGVLLRRGRAVPTCSSFSRDCRCTVPSLVHGTANRRRKSKARPYTGRPPPRVKTSSSTNGG